MARILSDLVVKNVGDGLWQLTEPLEYRVGNENSLEIITVPVNFISDFASVPTIFRGLIPKDGKYTIPAVLHDWNYTVHYYSRKRCDEIFFESMQVIGVSWWKRHVMFRAVRLFGGSAYANK